MQTGTRVAFNTFSMYAKALITVVASLYSTRIVLLQLGENDYGAFNLAAGIIGLLTFMSASLGLTSQRYLSYSLGKKDEQLFYDVFNISRKLCIALAVAVLTVIETLMLCFLDRLKIEPDRLFAVSIVFHSIALSTFVSVLTAPYDAIIMAKEDIFVNSLIYIVEALLKLGIAFYLIVTPYDKLLVYAILLAVIYMCSNAYKVFYCRRYLRTFKAGAAARALRGEIVRFTLWSSFEPLFTALSMYGVAIALNIYGGTAVNAAYGISNQVSAQMVFFSTALLSAVLPQIVKSEGGGDRQRTLRLCLFACKLSFFIIALFAIPAIAEMPYILALWLKEVPEHTVLFCRLMLISALISNLTYGLYNGIQAVGRIRRYQMAMGIVKVSALLLVWILLHLQYPVYYAVMSFAAVEMALFCLRLYNASKEMGLVSRNYFVHVCLPLLLAAAATVALLLALHRFLSAGFFRAIVVFASSGILMTLLLKLLILSKNEYLQTKAIITGLLKKITSK